MAIQVEGPAEDNSVGQEEQGIVQEDRGIAEEEAANTWVHCKLVVMGQVLSGSLGHELQRLQVAPAR